MYEKFKTQRLSITAISAEDAAFILELVNTPGWLQFIGERHVKSLDDSGTYIQKLIENPDVTCWTVRWSENRQAIGIITFIKRKTLQHRDIGFAFLPQYAKQGFALEATAEVLKHLSVENPTILATALKANTSSIHLLTKLGFSYDSEIELEGEMLSLYTRQFVNPPNS